MSNLVESGFGRYLLAKRTVDDRSLSPRVWDRLSNELRRMDDGDPLRVLEVGAGIGTMVERMSDAGMLGRCDYTLLDSDAELVRTARERLALRGGLTLEFVAADAFEFILEQRDRRLWDLVIANAFLDLTDVGRSVPLLCSASRPGGLLYLTINYDGVTGFAPVIDPELDARIESLYNQAMRAPRADGVLPTGSHTGRQLFPALRETGAVILEAGSSDWVVYASETEYPADEAFFLSYILGFVEQTLTGNPELDQHQLSEWLETRRRQIETGELVYIAHQLDVLARI